VLLEIDPAYADVIVRRWQEAKGTDLCAHSADELAAVATALNARPRKTLGWRTPAEMFDRALRSAHPVVATTDRT
jgi:IS30 family transposase